MLVRYSGGHGVFVGRDGPFGVCEVVLEAVGVRGVHFAVQFRGDFLKCVGWLRDNGFGLRDDEFDFGAVVGQLVGRGGVVAPLVEDKWVELYCSHGFTVSTLGKTGFYRVTDGGGRFECDGTLRDCEVWLENWVKRLWK